MATYQLNDFTWKQGVLKLSQNIPVYILEIDCGTALSYNDHIERESLLQVAQSRPRLGVTMGGMLIGNNFNLPNLPSQNETYYTKTFDNYTVGLYVDYNTSAFSGAKRYNLTFDVNGSVLESNTYLHGGIFGSGYGTWNNTESFKFAFLVYDVVAQKYISLINWLPSFQVTYTSSIPSTSDLIGVTNYANGVPLATPPNDATFSITYDAIVGNMNVPIYNILNNYDVVDVSDLSIDPYAGAGDSETGGGDGTFDGSSDAVDIPSLPSVGATDSGFITLFAPSMAQLKALAHYMWTNPLFDVETGFKKLFSDPMDCILGLSVVPVAVPTSGAQNVNIGNLVTSVTMNVASQQYIEIDCGSISFANKFFGSYLDYEPYTKMAIFVPYSGVHSLSADDIMGKIVRLVYHIDILTGSLVAFLKCGDSVLYEFNGACGSNIPVNSLNYASTIENAIRIAVNIGTTVATAGAAAPAAMGAEAVGGAMTARNIATGINIAGSTAEGALSLKPNIDRAGSLGGTTGLLGNQTPYIIITRPRLCKPKYQNKIKGYPSFITCTLGDLDGKGYTEIDTVILNNIYLTDAEKDELIGVLKGGVYL